MGQLEFYRFIEERNGFAKTRYEKEDKSGELLNLIGQKEKNMIETLQKIQELKSDVNMDRAELVQYYREFADSAERSA